LSLVLLGDGRLLTEKVDLDPVSQTTGCPGCNGLTQARLLGYGIELVISTVLREHMGLLSPVTQPTKTDYKRDYKKEPAISETVLS
jgi:hypothetical protein